jgi:hypothetical protein
LHRAGSLGEIQKEEGEVVKKNWDSRYDHLLFGSGNSGAYR